MTRRDSLEKLLSELEAFVINHSQYWNDLEPQAVYDSAISGKLNALGQWCQTLGWSDLAQSIHELLPIHGSAPEILTRVQSYLIPEIRHNLKDIDIDGNYSPDDFFWELLHPRIRALAKPRFESGFLGDAVETAFKEVNDTVKRIYQESKGVELDGAGLMTTALSPNNPIIKLSPLETDSDRNKQQGYMQIFAGAMTGIRNPKAHANIESSRARTLHLLSLASLLMHQIDDRT
ncbi:TIGR02391 family protein [Methylophaga nitratireducenticrescens]|uniref:TIGR02391 family protein n=1 Tax=Methylophaga nitratireducenticrescens TaxID=754476 RepID=UPI000CDBBB7C|nr:TIGR02391 family protein [Methylophaga nitratireducenticrescens]AUZ84773.1 TIGR02391 family protein [Methylophaga nitratireducenticrescens]